MIVASKLIKQEPCKCGNKEVTIVYITDDKTERPHYGGHCPQCDTWSEWGYETPDGAAIGWNTAMRKATGNEDVATPLEKMILDYERLLYATRMMPKAAIELIIEMPNAQDSDMWFLQTELAALEELELWYRDIVGHS